MEDSRKDSGNNSGRKSNRKNPGGLVKTESYLLGNKDDKYMNTAKEVRNMIGKVLEKIEKIDKILGNIGIIVH